MVQIVFQLPNALFRKKTGRMDMRPVPFTQRLKSDWHICRECPKSKTDVSLNVVKGDIL
jgi:hypothetical protein